MMVEVAVKVPEDHVGEFYSMYGLWLQRLQRGDAEIYNAAIWGC
jgi:hypothetical protein